MINVDCKKLLVLCFTLLTGVGCGNVATVSSTPSSFILAGNYWPDYTAIPVCFLNRQDFEETLVKDYKAIVEQEYYSKTSVRFTRWDDCTPDDQNKAVVRIRLDSSTITVYEGGYWGAVGGKSRVGAIPLPLEGEESATMRLEAPEIWANFSKPGNNFFLHEVLHEFGHVVGLMHEHQRTDSTQSCVGDAAAELASRVPSSEVFVYSGAYDSKSIMSYCNPLTNTLSSGDVLGIAEIVTRAAAFSPGQSPTPPPVAVD